MQMKDDWTATSTGVQVRTVHPGAEPSWSGASDEQGRATGPGVLVLPSILFRYEGPMVAGAMHGNGSLTIGPHDEPLIQATGEFRDGKMTGRIRLVAKYGTYVGDVREQLFHGVGKMTYTNGAIYEGDWRDGHRDGIGTLTDEDGSSYRGSWRRDLYDGNGVITQANGDRYAVAFQMGKLVSSAPMHAGNAVSDLATVAELLRVQQRDPNSAYNRGLQRRIDRNTKLNTLKWGMS